MKRVFSGVRLLLIVAFATIQLVACADNDKVIEFKELPQAAQSFVKKYFSGKQVVLVKKDRDGIAHDYDVVMADGTKLEFDSKGAWTDVDCRMAAVPQDIVPEAIRQYVKKNFPQMRIRKIERSRKGYEIKLSNGTEIEFNKKMKVVDIDL